LALFEGLWLERGITVAGCCDFHFTIFANNGFSTMSVAGIAIITTNGIALGITKVFV
jgi:hypothetical protein